MIDGGALEVPAVSSGICSHLACRLWWRDGLESQSLEVLYDGGEVEFVTCTGQTSEPHAFKAVVDLEVGKAHLDALTFVP